MKGYSSIGSYYNVAENMSKSLVLQGYVFWSFAVLILGSMSNTIRTDATKGTLEQKAMAVVPLQFLLLGDFISNLLVNIIVVCTICVISILFLGTTIYFNILTIGALIITLLGMYGISLIFGGIALISKRINNLVYIFQLILLIVSNAVFQIEGTAEIGKIFPITTGIEIGRKYMIGAPVGIGENIFFIFSSLIWLIAGIFTFEFFMRKSKYKGILAQY
jgi:ABC-2 type transport system permease protein